MKKFLKVCFVLCLCGACFMLGWRVMPKVWPTIKQNVYYKVFPTPAPTPRPSYAYAPTGTAAFADPITPTDSLVYYFYRETCGSCIGMQYLLEGLPEQVVLADGTVSQVKFVPINSRDEALRPVVMQAYADYAVAEDEQQVPAVIIGDRCIMLPADIYRYFYEALLSGEGLNTPLLNGQERTP